VICRDFIYDTMMNAGAPEHVIEFFHGYTYSGHPVACAAAVATLQLMKDEDLFARAGTQGRVLGDAMHSALKGLPNVVSIRTLGLAGAVELAPAAAGPGKRAYDIMLDCFHHGVWLRAAGDNIVICPPYIVTHVQIEQMVQTLADSIRRHA
jgi:beta-alanine--pyruvate transaminase